MKKKIKRGLLVIGVIAVGCYGFIRSTTVSGQLDGLVLANIEALAQSEGGDNGSSDSVDCYSTYNNCWFWNCSTIYRCNVSNCQTVSADDYSKDNRCYKR